MDNNLQENLTVIMPTHKRENYLRRSINYWRHFDVRVIIVDSSPDVVNIETPTHIEYHHCVGQGFSAKVKKAMDMVQTPYVVMCPDDDFQTEQGLVACIEFLEQNPDYSCAQGRHICFKQDNGEILVKEIYRSEDDFHVNDKEVTARVEKGLFNYNLWYWSVHRSDVLKQIYKAYENISNGNLIEIGVVMGHLAQGGHIQLPVFYQAREVLPNSWGRVEAFLPFDDEEHLDVTLWREKSVEVISSLAGLEHSKALEVVASAEQAYSRFIIETQDFLAPEAKFYEMVDKILPKPVSKILLYIKRKFKPSTWQLGYNQQASHHWDDEQARNSWQLIINTLEQSHDQSSKQS